jgi:Bacterial dipeptidyl-peptidase Sh3 domain/NlpC/P60 family
MDDADPRLTPARGDLAAKYLEGKVEAARFVTGEEFEIADAIAPLRRASSFDAELMTQALMGERVTIYDRNSEGWAWGQLNGDGYVGWLPDAALTKPTGAPTHGVTALRTFAFPGPSIKLPPVETLTMGAALTVLREEGPFAVTREGWYLPRQHIGPIDCHAADFVTVAEEFVDTPYLWGGKSSLGIDCSGLVQVSLAAAGITCLRDSDMQEKALGRELDPKEPQRLKRGDLIFWKGHVAIARDAGTIVHANAHHMTTTIEPTAEAIARIKASGSEVTAIKRLG